MTTGSTIHSHITAHHQSTKSINGISNDNNMEDDEGRTRNAKAQRRHREKRKAHLKTLEESVVVLTSQLEDARRQLSTAAYNSRLGGVPNSPLSPSSKDYVALQQENTYLRDENAELRRQLYSYTVGRYPENDVKPEGNGGGFQGYNGGGAGGPMTSPRDTTHGGRESQLPPPLGESSSGPSSGASYHHNGPDHFTPLSRGSRSRVMSSSSAPTASPYLPNSSSFPTDPRAHALSTSQAHSHPQHHPQHPPMDRYPPVRYDSHVYSSSSANHSPTGPAPVPPPPHSLPRSGLTYEHVDMYGEREGGSSSWGPESGPPPFQGSIYPVSYSDGPAQEEWRSAQDNSH